MSDAAFRTSRRALLGSSLGALGLLWLDAGPARAERLPGRRVLVCVFQRGALDGLNAVVPYTDPHYYRERPNIAIPPPGSGRGAARDLDGQFGLHPSLAPLLPAYRAGELAIVHAIGPSTGTRSHFDAQDDMESASHGPGASTDGWLNRCLALGRAEDLRRAVAISGRLPRALSGPAGALSSGSLRHFGVRAPARLRDELDAGFEALYSSRADLVGARGKQALDLTSTIRSLEPDRYRPERGAVYPKAFTALRDAALLIKAEIGVEVIWIDSHGWDTHSAQESRSRLPKRLDELARALAAFRTDLGERFEHVTLLTMTEFGRTVAQNGAGGTDHGRGSVMMVLGGAVGGGRVLGRFPGLAPEQRFEGRDLAVTTDYRDLFAEVARHQFGVTSFERIFPRYTPRPLGVMRS